MSEPATAWAEAFAKAQAEFPAIHKDKTVNTGSFSYRYADLPSILEAVNPILKEHGLAVAQAVISEEARVGVETRIYHTSGHVERFGPLFLHGGNDAKSAGSAVTYARRYSLCAALGIAADEDDDGAAASQPRSEPARSRSEVSNPSDPYCPACYHINGEIVGVWENDKKPYQKCKNKADACAGATPDKNGKLWSWSGWHESWEDSLAEWLEQNDGIEGFSKEEPDELSPGEWLKLRVAQFSEWTDEQRRGAYKAVMEELGIDAMDTLEAAQAIHKGMTDAYFTEFSAQRPF